MSEVPPPAAAALKPRRRGFQFSLRTLMLLMVVLSVGLGLFGRKLKQVREQRQAVAAIQKLGREVRYSYPASIFGGGSSIIPPGPAWLTRLLGNDFWGNVNFLDIHDSGDLTDAGLEHVKGLNQLESLWLDGTHVTDSGLDHLKGLNQLKTLSLGHTQITDAGLADLKGLSQLRDLFLSDTQISDAGLKHLKGLTQLANLYVLYTQVTDAGVADLQKALPNLRTFQ